MNTQDFHFERKVPDGKLVVADITHDGTTITAAQISGDFFLDPDEAYPLLNQALVGASVSEDAQALKKRLDQALSTIPQLSLHGFSTQDVAITARRAIAGAVDLTDFDWEILTPGVLPTTMNVALDEHLLKQVATGQRPATLRLWEWEDKATVIGSFQSYTNELYPEGVEKHNIQVVRRISGGGAMFMEGGNCITYSLYVPESAVAGLSYVDSYEYLDQWVLAGLKSLGVHAWYVPINDITSSGGKIGGAAQKRIQGAVLHHTTMSYDIDANKMMEVLRIGKVKIVDKGIRSANRRVDPLRRQTGIPRTEVIQTLIKTFINRYHGTHAELSETDIHAAAALVAEKYGTEAWTKRVP
ncbi:biotin/lipoate A/B protein ligase [Corynebacterium kutscheri]|uniref:Biotin/lipoate A/B protein ligase n=1 Tax=Corynebacterium kutscheri TaxID=35755 RepID=A0A0F6R0D6_9CORY|nr:biotin/lipoate A/B protein ligase family protein [Corynebacterium kutscheri]AKE41682.1 lipoate-protein ligase A [Corynebacterium kutscheri]VEH08958.1 biotin/lipoate A/B protein ligase [Corynebacterium kutscheri]VEH10009.1 biotin/lipoate A/B protein ligase [Corynebacterium kutscheri]VEH80090.1 biotin/lipoate A/B protein ligase [Corynebacterium kutscheri]